MNITRRAAIASAAAAAAAGVAPLALAAPFAWQARSGLTAGQYQALFDQLTPQGYRPALVDGYELNGQPTFAAIFNQTGGPAWVAHHNMTADQYQQTFDQLTAQGYRLWKVSGYAAGPVAHYAAIWVQTSGPAWQARHGMTSAEFQAFFDSATAGGFRPTWVSAYAVAGTPYFAALFEQIPNSPAWISHHGMTAAGYQATFDSATAQGYHPRLVSGYVVNNTPFFAAVWDQGNFPAWQARHNLNAAQFQATFDTLGQQGMRLTDVSGYGVSGQALFAGLWISG